MVRYLPQTLLLVAISIAGVGMYRLETQVNQLGRVLTEQEKQVTRMEDRLTVEPEPAPTPKKVNPQPEPPKPPDPIYLPKHKWGKAILLLSKSKELKWARESESTLRTFLRDSGAKDWIPWIAVWPDWDKQYAVVISATHWDAAHPFCHWMANKGWGYTPDGKQQYYGTIGTDRMCEWLPDCWGQPTWNLRTWNEDRWLDYNLRHGRELGVDVLTGEHKNPEGWRCWSLYSYGDLSARDYNGYMGPNIHEGKR